MDRDVFVRSDVASSSRDERSERTWAHEAVHLVQRGVHRRRLFGDQSDPISDLVAGVHQVAPSNAPLFQLDPDADFEPGIVGQSLEDVVGHPDWVENGIVQDRLREEPPYTYTVIYEDGTELEIPLSFMSFAGREPGAPVAFRRHRETGRIVPFSLAASDPAWRDDDLRALPWADALTRVLRPRFDRTLTPTIISYLELAQAIWVGRSFSEVLLLHTMNPALLGGGRTPGMRGRTTVPRGRAPAPRPRTPASSVRGPAVGGLVEGFDATESTIIREARGILRSPRFDLIRRAHVAGESVTVNIGGRTIQYEPALPASGMTMFGDNGFVIGYEAFSSSAELGRTLLHELYRLTTSASSGGVSAAIAAEETRAAASFAARALSALGL